MKTWLSFRSRTSVSFKLGVAVLLTLSAALSVVGVISIRLARSGMEQAGMAQVTDSLNGGDALINHWYGRVTAGTTDTPRAVAEIRRGLTGTIAAVSFAAGTEEEYRRALVELRLLPSDVPAFSSLAREGDRVVFDSGSALQRVAAAYEQLPMVLQREYMNGERQLRVTRNLSQSLIQLRNTGYLFVVDAVFEGDSGPSFALAHPTLENVDVWDASNVDGMVVGAGIATMNGRGRAAMGEDVRFDYRWQNSTDPVPRLKQNLLRYNADADVVMAAGLYVDEYLFTIDEIRVSLLVATLVLGVAAAILMILFNSRLAVRPMQVISQRIAEIAEGEADLTAAIGSRRKDEIGDLARNFDGFVERQRALIMSIQGVADSTIESQTDLEAMITQTSAASEEIAASSQTMTASVTQLVERMNTAKESLTTLDDTVGVLERSVQDQSSATEETTASVEEMTASLNNIAAMTRDRTESANQLLDSAGDGARHAEATSDKINTVARFAAEIGEMTDVIRSVAASTNMLAMNAAIEAAHAGDAGRGFAVVAGEIRKLAESAGANSSRIAKNVKEIVGGIQAATNAASENAERFGSIASEVQHIVETMEELSGAAREMSTGSEQIMEAMNGLRSNSATEHEQTERVRQVVEQQSAFFADLSDRLNAINSGMAEVQAGTREISSSMHSVTESTRSIGDRTRRLGEEVSHFKTA